MKGTINLKTRTITFDRPVKLSELCDIMEQYLPDKCGDWTIKTKQDTYLGEEISYFTTSTMPNVELIFNPENNDKRTSTREQSKES